MRRRAAPFRAGGVALVPEEWPARWRPRSRLASTAYGAAAAGGLELSTYLFSTVVSHRLLRGEYAI